MILSSVIIVLREVLEAALLISLLLAFSRSLQLNFRWALLALGLGVIGAWSYAHNLYPISNLFDGTGQEVINAFLQLLLVILLFAVIVAWMFNWDSVFKIFSVLAIVVALPREGSEIFLYLAGFLSLPEQLTSVLIGSLLGFGIGASVCALLYYGLGGLNQRTFTITAFFLAALISAGFSSQAMSLLIQADWFTVEEPLWDSSSLIAEDSVTGQLLYALLGYEANPYPQQMIIYLVVLVLFSLSAFYFLLLRTNAKNPNADV